MASVEQHQEKSKKGAETESRLILANNLNGLLDSIGWGTNDFHRRTGFSSHFLSSVLRGDQNPSIDNVHVMAISLGVQAYQVLNPRFESTDKSRVIDMLNMSNREVSELRKNASKGVTEPRQALAKHLRRLLAINGLTVAALSADVGIAPSTIQKCLKTTQNVTIDNLDRIAKGLGVAAFVLVLPADI